MHFKVGLFRTVSCLLLGLAVAACSPPNKKPLPKSDARVFPKIAEKTPPVELSEFIADAVPETGFEKIGWDYLSNSQVQWVTAGFENEGGTYTMRRGLARIRVGGIATTVLRQSKEELAWSIVLLTEGNPKFGPTFMNIEPGFDFAKEVGLDDANGQPGICHGTLFTGCDFKVTQALASHRIRSTLLCKGEYNRRPDVYEIRVAKKAPALLAYFWGGGSGGEEANIELHPLADKERLCSQQ